MPNLQQNQSTRDTLRAGKVLTVTVTTGSVGVSIPSAAINKTISASESFGYFDKDVTFELSAFSGAIADYSISDASPQTENVSLDANNNLVGADNRRIAKVVSALTFSDEAFKPSNWVKRQLFTAAQAGVANIYWLWPFDTTGKIEAATHKWYIYYSTDHDTGLGGIYLTKTDDLENGPFVHVGLVYQDTASYNAPGNPQTETPSVLWDYKNNRMALYYQNTGAKYGASNSVNARGGQSTLMAYSTNGTDFTKDPNFIIDVPFYSSQVGDGHTGYFLPFKTRRGLFAYSLHGGSNFNQMVLWKNIGELAGRLVGSKYLNDWKSDRLPLGYGSDVLFQYEEALFTGNKKLNWNHSFVAEIRGVEYWIGLITNGVSGGGSRIGRIAIAPISADYKNLLETPKTIWEPGEAWESNDIRSLTYAIDGSYLRLFYTLESSKSGVISYVV